MSLSGFASPARPSGSKSAIDLQEAWNSAGAALEWPQDLRNSGWELLQRMSSTTDKLAEQDAQVRAPAQRPEQPPCYVCRPPQPGAGNESWASPGGGKPLFASTFPRWRLPRPGALTMPREGPGCALRPWPMPS